MTSRSHFAGIDWASQSHTVCVLDAAGAVELRLDLPHNKEGIERLIRQLKSFAGIVIAIERPSGLLVDALVEAGLRVVPIHPNVLKASRARYRGAGKSDPGDAYMLADILRTDGHRFRLLEAQSDEIRALRALVRTRDDLVDSRVALANQLRSLLESYWPGAAEIFFDIDSPIALAFISRYPTPQSVLHCSSGSRAPPPVAAAPPPSRCSRTKSTSRGVSTCWWRASWPRSGCTPWTRGRGTTLGMMLD